jgi:hypothetical protein
VVLREAAGEETGPVAAALERRHAEVEDDDAALLPLRRGAPLGDEDPRLCAVLVDRDGRGLHRLSGLRLRLRIRRGRRVGGEHAERVEPGLRLGRKAREQARSRKVGCQGAAGGDEGDHQSGHDGK